MNRRDFLSWAGKISILAAIVPKVEVKAKEPLPIYKSLHPKYTMPTAISFDWQGTGNVWKHNAKPLEFRYTHDSQLVDIDRDPF